ncbi:MAG: leucine-rich repeat protein [Eubacterium sp.]|nr:leucine-rich repeat protein [Eubacterium sp.]
MKKNISHNKSIAGKMIFCGAFLFMTMTLAILADTADSHAKVRVLLKGTTLTVSGKGAMKESQVLSYKKRQKIKKVVIKNGVTQIAPYAFSGSQITKLTIPRSVKKIGWGILNGCRIKTLKMPGTFESVWPYEEGGYDSINIGGVHDYIGKVKFISDTDYDSLSRIFAKNIIVSKNDPLFSSEDGVVYSKDQKILRMVPALRKELVIRDGCEIIDTGAFLYGTADYEGDVDMSVTGLLSITIPSTVETVVLRDDGMLASVIYAENGIVHSVNDIKILTSHLSESSVKKLWDTFTQARVSLTKEFTSHGYVKNTDDMIIFGNEVYGYSGNETKINIPEGITSVAADVFRYKKLDKVTFPSSLISIGKYAFANNNLTEIELNEGLKLIDDGAFLSNNITELKFPATLTELGSDAFADNDMEFLDIPATITSYHDEPWGAFRACDRLKSVVLPEGMTALPDGMFLECTALEHVRIPSTLVTIGRISFDGCTSLDINELLSAPSITAIEYGAFREVPWTELTLHENIRHLGTDSFVRYGADGKYEKAPCTVRIANPDIEMEKDVFPYKNLTLIYPEDQFEKAKTEVYYAKTLFHNYKKGLIQSRFRFHRIDGADGYQMKVYSYSGKKKLLGTYSVRQDAHTADTDVLPFEFDNSRLTAKVRPFRLVDGKKVYGQWSGYSEYR